MFFSYYKMMQIFTIFTLQTFLDSGAHNLDLSVIVPNVIKLISTNTKFFLPW